MVEHVDEESLDVRSVLVLICHDHNLTVSETVHFLKVVVFLPRLKSHDLHDVIDLRIVYDLFGGTVSNIQ